MQTSFEKLRRNFRVFPCTTLLAFREQIKLTRDTIAGLKNGSKNQGEPRFCPDTNSAAARECALEGTERLCVSANRFSRYESERRGFGGSITPLCSIDANFSGAKSECLFDCFVKFSRFDCKNRALKLKFWYNFGASKASSREFAIKLNLNLKFYRNHDDI